MAESAACIGAGLRVSFASSAAPQPHLVYHLCQPRGIGAVGQGSVAPPFDDQCRGAVDQAANATLEDQPHVLGQIGHLGREFDH